jgi:hypothetical protein
MTLNIDFTPQETAWLNAQAQQQGLPPAEIIKRLIDAQVATTPAPPAPATLAKPPLDPEQEAAIALLDSWIAEGLAADPQTRRQAEEELEEFKRNMNANRAATGERLVYP